MMIALQKTVPITCFLYIFGPQQKNVATYRNISEPSTTKKHRNIKHMASPKIERGDNDNASSTSFIDAHDVFSQQ